MLCRLLIITEQRQPERGQHIIGSSLFPSPGSEYDTSALQRASKRRLSTYFWIHMNSLSLSWFFKNIFPAVVARSPSLKLTDSLRLCFLHLFIAVVHLLGRTRLVGKHESDPVGKDSLPVHWCTRFSGATVSTRILYILVRPLCGDVQHSLFFQ